jgi:hypothetical protein
LAYRSPDEKTSWSFKGDKEYLGSLAKSSGKSVDVRHAEQRFGYIRQGIMYSEDTALEGLDGDPKPGKVQFKVGASGILAVIWGNWYLGWPRIPHDS